MNGLAGASIGGELQISLQRAESGWQCQIRSTRPLSAARVFAGKSVKFTLMSLPMLFNVCAKAQACSLVRAVESAQGQEAAPELASQREALVLLETLREQVLRVLMDWPGYLGSEAAESPVQASLATVVQGVSGLSAALKPAELYALGASPQAVDPALGTSWQELERFISQLLFAQPAQEWLGGAGQSVVALQHWATSAPTLDARFLQWLGEQSWRGAGASSVEPLPDLDDAALFARLQREGEQFTAAPQWGDACYESSWFSRLQGQPLVAELVTEEGNGLYTRCVARLVAIADLMVVLDDFFLRGKHLSPIACDQPGMAHTEAARGRLTHLLELDGDSVARLLVLAPTEWNFCTAGVAAKGLENLQADEASALQQQARLLIHAIDPCVGHVLDLQP